VSLLPPTCPTCTIEPRPYTQLYAVVSDHIGPLGCYRCPVCGTLTARPIDLAEEAERYLAALSPE
jgi:hypothetical protein